MAVYFFKFLYRHACLCNYPLKSSSYLVSTGSVENVLCFAILPAPQTPHYCCPSSVENEEGSLCLWKNPLGSSHRPEALASESSRQETPRALYLFESRSLDDPKLVQKMEIPENRERKPRRQSHSSRLQKTVRGKDGREGHSRCEDSILVQDAELSPAV